MVRADGLLLLIRAWIQDLRLLDNFFESVTNSTLTLVNLHASRLVIGLALQLL